MAKNTISLRVSLTGDERIKQQFEGLTKAGQEAANTLSKAFGSLDLGVKTAAAAEALGRNLGGLRDSINSVVIRAGALKLAVEAAAGAFLLLSKNAAKNAADVGQQAEAFGLTTDKYQAFKSFAAQGGLSAQQFGAALRKLSTEITAAGDRARKSGDDLNKGIRPAFETFEDGAVAVRRFGPAYDKAADDYERFADVVTSRGANDIPQTLRAAANAFKAMPDGATKTTFALRLFGEEVGGLLLKKLNQGGKALDDFVRQFEASGVKLSGNEIEIGVAQTASLTKLGQTIANTRDKLVLLFSPAVIAAANSFNSWLERNQATLREFGLTVATEVLTVINDLRDAFTGNDSQVKNGWVLDLRDGFVALKDAALKLYTSAIKPLFAFIKEQADTVAGLINQTFGTRLTGGSLLAAAALLKLLGVFRLVGFAVGAVARTFQVLGLVLVGVTRSFGGLGPLITGFFRFLVSGAAALLRFIPLLLGWPALLVAGVVAAGAALVGFWPQIVDGAKAAWAKLQAVASDVWDGLKKVFADGWDGVKQIAADAWAGIGSAVSDGWAGIQKLFSDAGDGLKKVVSDVWLGIIDVFSTGWDAIKSAVSQGWEGIKTVTRDSWNGIKGVVSDAFEGVKTVVSDGWEGAKTLSRSAIDGVKTAVRETWAGVKDIVKEALSGVETVASETWEAVRSSASGLSDKLKPVWDTIGSAATKGFTFVAEGATRIWTGATSTVEQAAKDIKAAIEAATNITQKVGGAEELAAKLVAPFRQAREQIEQVWAGISASVWDKLIADAVRSATAVDAISAAVERLRGTLKGVPTLNVTPDTVSGQVGNDRLGGGAGTDVLQPVPGVDFTQTQANGTAAFAAIYQKAAEVFGLIQADANTLGQSIRDFIGGAFASVETAAQAASSAVQSAADAMRQALQGVLNTASQIGQATGGMATGFAVGGYVSGPGTSTSDSIPARLSAGEFVVRAAAVKRYGVDLLHALNGMRISLPSLRDGIQGFAMGGLVQPVAMPALAGAGGSTGRPLVLNIGGESFALSAPQDVADKLTRYAAKRVVASAGRRPSWVGG